MPIVKCRCTTTGDIDDVFASSQSYALQPLMHTMGVWYLDRGIERPDVIARARAERLAKVAG